MTDKHAVLWDMDGVLVDTTELHFRAWSKVLAPYEIPFSREIFLSTFGMTNDPIIRSLLDNPSDETVDEVANAKEVAFRSNVPGNVDLLPGVREWLERFHEWGWPQAIVSSAPAENIHALIDETGIRGYFQALVSAVVMPSKPDPAVYLEGARLLGVPTGACLVMEDAPAGVEGARRAGMKCIAVTTTHDAGELEDATLVVERLSGLSEEDVRGIWERMGD